MTGLQKGG
jgi:hypothetical protein